MWSSGRRAVLVPILVCLSLLVVLAWTAGDSPSSDFDMAWQAVLSSATSDEPKDSTKGFANSHIEGVRISKVNKDAKKPPLVMAKASDKVAGTYDIPVRNLFDACVAKNIKRIKQLLETGVDVNTYVRIRDNENFAPLHVSAMIDDVEAIELLVAAGADINIAAGDGSTPLFIAVTSKRLESTRKLLELGANPNAQKRPGLTPLQLAVDMKLTEYVELLLQYGSVVVDSEELGGTMVFNAVMKGATDIVELLGAYGFDMNRPRKDNKGTGWHAAAMNGNKQIAEVLHKYGGSPNLRMKDGVTPLHVAAEYASLGFVRWMLSLPGIEVNIHTNRGQSPYDIAVFKKRDDVVEALVAAGGTGGTHRLLLPPTEKEIFWGRVKSIILGSFMLFGPLIFCKVVRKAYVEPKRKAFFESLVVASSQQSKKRI